MEILNKVGRLSAQEMLEKIEKAALINYGLHRYQSKNTFQIWEKNCCIIG